MSNLTPHRCHHVMWAVLLKERTWPKSIFIPYFIINKKQRKLSAHAQAIMLLPDYTIILMRQRRYYVTTSWKFALGRQTGHDLAPLLGHEASKLRLHLAVTALQGLWKEDWLVAAPAWLWFVLALTSCSDSDTWFWFWHLILALTSIWLWLWHLSGSGIWLLTGETCFAAW